MRSSRRRARGFTLVELSIVVVIIGIMATLAVFGVSKYIRSSKTAEAVQMIGAIKAAQEAFFDETFRYYDVSLGNMDTNLYPSIGTAGHDKAQWGDPADPATARWQTLGVTPEAPVLFRYASIAGTPAQQPSDADFGTDNVAYNLAAVANPSHWYLVKAVADLDRDESSRTVFAGSNFTSEIYSQNVGD